MIIELYNNKTKKSMVFNNLQDVINIASVNISINNIEDLITWGNKTCTDIKIYNDIKKYMIE